MTVTFLRFSIGVLMFCASLSVQSQAQSLQTASVSAPDSTVQAPLGGNGDSISPIVSADGRFVVFASTAFNLSLSSNNISVTPGFPPKLNVFIKDRLAGTTTLVSVNSVGMGAGNDDSLPAAVSRDGRYVLFESRASDLVAGDTNNASDIFLRDMVAGATTLISTNAGAGFGNGASQNAVMTSDGRFVTFSSFATNFVSADTNRIVDVFLRDNLAGTTILISTQSITRTFSAFPDGSDQPQITPDGRYVAFSSTASNIVPGLTNRGEVYVRDVAADVSAPVSGMARSLALTVFGTTAIVCYGPMISSNGQFVVFQVSPELPSSPYGTALLLRYDTHSGFTDIISTNGCGSSQAQMDLHTFDMTPDGRYVVFLERTNAAFDSGIQARIWDGASGSVSLVSATISNTIPQNTICEWPTIDAAGRTAAFFSTAINLTTNALSPGRHLYVRDLVNTNTTLADVCPDGSSASGSLLSFARLSEDGRFVAFDCSDARLTGDTDGRVFNVYLRDLVAGTNELISIRSAGWTQQTGNGFSSISSGCSSSNGQAVVFTSDASNMVQGDTNGFSDVFLRDLIAGTNQMISMATNGAGGKGMSTEAVISADGKRVAFTSGGSDLVPGDTNRTQDVFVRDVTSGATILVSIATNGISSGNDASYSPSISADGRFVLFRSRSTNLAPGTFTSQSENLFLRDLQVGTTIALTTQGLAPSAATTDLRWVAYGPSSGSLYIWDTLAGARVYTNSIGTISTVALSANGQRLAFASAGKSYVTDRSWATNALLGSVTASSHTVPALDSAGSFAANVLTAGGTNQVYLYDFQAGSNMLVSAAFDTLAGGNGNSDSCAITPDSRFLVYRSVAANIVPGDTNGASDLFLFDRVSGTTTLLSMKGAGTGGADNWSFRPVFSPDAGTLFFQTWAGSVLTNDCNLWGDVVALKLPSSQSISAFVGQIILARAGLAPIITWPAVPGQGYRVQFKNNLFDPSWLPVNGRVTIIGNQGRITDISAPPTRRFYRIVSL